jgi:TolA-binding protein
MRWRAWALVTLALLGAWVVVRAQQPPQQAAVTCEMQLGEAYRQLVTEQIVAPGRPATTWQEQLTTLATELRTLLTQQQIEAQQHGQQDRQQTRTLAQVVEGNRQLQQQVQTLTQQLADLKTAPAPAPAAPPPVPRE